MTTLKDNAVEDCPWESGDISLFLCAPGRGTLPLPIYLLAKEAHWSPASGPVSSTRKTELGMQHQVASQYPALRPPISRAMEC